MGKIIKWVFIAFNLLMILWVILGVTGALDGIETRTEAEQTGAAIGTFIGLSMVMVFWVLGDIILGLLVLLTRGQKILITEEQ